MERKQKEREKGLGFQQGHEALLSAFSRTNRHHLKLMKIDTRDGRHPRPTQGLVQRLEADSRC
jgi:hypothetical protein